jgi:hypothetical protein
LLCKTGLITITGTMTWVGLVPFVESKKKRIASGGFMPPLMLQEHVCRLKPYTQHILVAISMKTPNVEYLVHVYKKDFKDDFTWTPYAL